MAAATLTREQELTLALQAKAGDVKARHALICANMRYADHFIAKMHLRASLDTSDLRAEAYIGLLVALDRFKPEYGYRFMTYAMAWVRVHVFAWLRREHSVVYVPPKKGAAARSADVHLDAPLPGGGEATYLEMLESPGPDPEDVLLVQEHDAQIATKAQGLLDRLDKREQRIVEARLMRDREDILSLQDLGTSDLNLSRERIRQLEARAIATMRHAARKAS
jgi:RNA polymerase sigma factor (sigma-70 family)